MSCLHGGKYPDELRERPARLVCAIRVADEPQQLAAGSRRLVCDQLGINGGPLHSWVKQERVDDGELPGGPAAMQPYR